MGRPGKVDQLSEPVGLSAALSELAGLLLSTKSFEDLVQGVAELTVRSVKPATTVGITLAQDGRPYTVAAADALANQLDEQQYERDLGPCLQALATERPVHVPDLADEDRWADYPAVAMGLGMRSVLSIPLIVAGKAMGVLNIYAGAPNAFNDTDYALAWLLAGQASIAVTAALRRYDEVSLSENLKIALSSRAVIDQAIGILMAQRRCNAKRAFAVLRTISQRRNVKLRHVATELVEAISRRPGHQT